MPDINDKDVRFNNNEFNSKLYGNNQLKYDQPKTSGCEFHGRAKSVLHRRTKAGGARDDAGSVEN